MVTTPVVIQLSAREYLVNGSKSDDDLAHEFSNARYIMYCGVELATHSNKIASAIMKAWASSSSGIHDIANHPLLEFIDWSNPDPSLNDDYKGASKMAKLLEEANANSKTGSFARKVWKVTNASHLDVAGHTVCQYFLYMCTCTATLLF